MIPLRMAILDYQSGDDAESQRRGQPRLKLFGGSRTEMWRVLADQIGGRYQEGGLFRGHNDRVIADVPPWRVVLDTYTDSDDNTRYTRMRAPYVNADGFRFTIYRKGPLTGLGKLLGLQDVEVGYPVFDETFVIKGNDEEKLRRLFANERLRLLIEAEPDIYLSVQDDDGLFNRFPEGVDQLCFVAGSLITDIVRLKLLYDLFAETLQTLCQIGSAYEDDPRARAG